MKEETKKKITVLIMFIGIGTFLYLSVYLRMVERKRIIENGKDVIGTVTSLGLKSVDISYNWEGKDYVYTEKIPFPSIQVGEQFYCRVNCDNLTEIIVFDNKPFIDTILYKFEIIKPSKVTETFLEDNFLEFEYNINGKNYDREQYFDGDVSMPQNLSKLKVKYRIDRPEIGYLVEIKD